MQQAVATFVVLTVVAASLIVWSKIIGRVRRREPILDFEPRRSVPWTLLDLVLVFTTHIAFGALGHALLKNLWQIDLPGDIRDLSSREFMAFQLMSIVTILATAIVALTLVRVRWRATIADLGATTARLKHDALQGGLAFLALAPPIYALQAALVYFFPTQHPLIDLVRAQPDRAIFLVVALAVSLVAPLSEEFFMRVLFQGWLERLLAATTPGAFPSLEDRPRSQELVSGHTDSSISPDFRDDRDASSRTTVAAPSSSEKRMFARSVPIVTSSLVFSLLHLGHGPAPIPLFFLALGLGFLYQRTHRLWPSVVLHFLLNTTSLSVLWMETS